MGHHRHAYRSRFAAPDANAAAAAAMAASALLPGAKPMGAYQRTPDANAAAAADACGARVPNAPARRA